MNRPDISRLNKNRGIFFQIGLMTSLCMVIFAFNITVYEYENTGYIPTSIEEDIFDPVVRTLQISQPKPPPPVLKLTDNIIPDDPEYTEEPLPEFIKSDFMTDTLQLNLGIPKIIRERPMPSADLQLAEIVEKAPPIWEVVEEMPRFQGCEDSGLTKAEKQTCADKALLEYIYSNIKYPELARINGIEGTVVLAFVVEETGEITHINILKEIGGGCGNEVVRVVKGMPDWVPGKQRGKEVRVRFKLPVVFKLQ